MARLLRVEFAGAIYHVTIRGNNRQEIFRDARDRERFLKRLGEYAEEYGVRVYAFCLMTNHVHLVVETPHANLGRFLHKLQTAYTIYFQLRHRGCGHLMQGRYGAKAVEGDEYLLQLARYVHLNPVFVGSVKSKPVKERIRSLRGYRWSSYRRYLGKREWAFVKEGPLLAMMGGGTRARRRVAMRRFIEAGIAEEDEQFKDLMSASRLGIGSEEFLLKVQDLHEQLTRQWTRKEDVALRRVGQRHSAEKVIAAVCERLGVEQGELRRQRRGSWVRPVAAWVLSRQAGLTQREIAAWLGVATGKAVSVQIERVRRTLATDGGLGRLVAGIEQQLSKAGPNA